MADWAKSHFDSIEDRSPADADMQWRFARKVLGFEQLGVSRFTFAPNTRFPFAHRHREQEEAYVVVDGSGRVKLDDEIVEVERWDILRVGPWWAVSSRPGRTASNSSASAARSPRAGTASRSTTSGTERR